MYFCIEFDFGPLKFITFDNWAFGTPGRQIEDVPYPEVVGIVFDVKLLNVVDIGFFSNEYWLCWYEAPVEIPKFSFCLAYTFESAKL